MAQRGRHSGGNAPRDGGTGDRAILSGKRGEQVVFALLAVIIWPFIAVGIVGGYGFLVWMYQLLSGPPGPPAG